MDEKKICNKCQCAFFGDTCPLCNKKYDSKKERAATKVYDSHYEKVPSQRVAVRAGFTQAFFNLRAIRILASECVYVSIIAGLFFRSWFVFGGVALFFIASFFFKKLAIIVSVTLAISMGVAGFLMGRLLFGTNAAIVISVLSLVVGLLINLTAIGWMRDMKDRS